VHNKPSISCISLNEFSRLSVEVLENINEWMILWLIDWFKGVESTVASPSLQESLMDLEPPVDGLEVDVIVLLGREVPISKPVGGLDWPMSEMSSVVPPKI